MAKLFKTETTRAAAHGGLLAFSFFASLFTLLLQAAGPPQKSQFSDEWKGWKSYPPIWHPSGKLYGEQLLESFEIQPAELTDGLTFSPLPNDPSKHDVTLPLLSRFFHARCCHQPCFTRQRIAL